MNNKLGAGIDKSSDKYRQYVMKKGALVKIVLFLCAIVIGGVASLIIPLRPQESITEKRTLSTFPEFTLTTFLDGTYFADIDTWFADTFPGRDGLIACSEYMTDLYGIRNNVIHGEVVKGDDIPDIDFDETEFGYLDNIASEKAGDDSNGADPDDVTGETTANYSYDDSQIVDPNEIGDSVDSDSSSTGGTAMEGESLGSIFVVGDSAYNYYSFSKTVSDEYVSVVNDLATKLGSDVNVYSMIIPTSIDITLDDATRNSISSSNQQKAILYMYNKMNKNIGKCYIYDLLRSHRDEYIYFRTDHHWTALGAYYAYTAFMAQLGKTAYSLDSFKACDMGDFVGSYYTQTRASALSANPDTLIAYEPFSTNALKMINNEYDFIDYNIITDVSGWNSTSKYSAFIGGDNAYTEITNPNITDGSSVLIIKESFGNAMVPFFVENFQYVYVVDYRYYKGTVSELVKEYDIENVLFANNISVTSTADRVAEIKKVCQ